MMFFGFFGFLVLIVIVIVAVLMAQSGSTSTDIFGGITGSYEDPIGIAEKRYAKGEISKEEFDRLKRDLSS